MSTKSKPKPRAYFEVYSVQDDTGQSVYRFRLRAPNHEIVCQGEAFTTRQGALRSIAALRRHVPNAEVRRK